MHATELNSELHCTALPCIKQNFVFTTLHYTELQAMGDVDAKMGSIGRTKEELNDVQVNISHSHFADGRMINICCYFFLIILPV